jgi:tRNA-dihydrouridine synthase A
MARGFTKKTVLYTEMVVDDTVIHSPNIETLVGRDIEEEPSVIQMGGFNPETMARAAEILQTYGRQYGEININCGCPSPRVSKRSFGAKLMLEPDLVREIVHTISRRVDVPVTVKCRIGVDERESFPELVDFISAAHSGGATKFIIHSRKCILGKLTPKQNRDIPPLKYEVVHRLVKDFPDLKFVLNGGIQSFGQALGHLDNTYQYRKASADLLKGWSSGHDAVEGPELGLEVEESLPGVHGIMIGRAAYNNPLLLATADSVFFGQPDPCLTRRQILDRYISYCEWIQSENGVPKQTGR